MTPTLRRALLTIAGTDPTSGAGVTADIAVFGDFGWHGLWVPTALLDQDTRTVHRLDPRPPQQVIAAVARVLAHGQPAAVKLGVLASSEVATALSELLEQQAGTLPVILDPILASGLGRSLADSALVATLRARLLPVITVLTPNVPEAEALTGRRIADLEAAREAAEQLVGMGAQGVLLKGGHLPGAPADVWASSAGSEVWKNEGAFPGDVHGTGCHLSSALAALLAEGASPRTAAKAARRYLSGCMTSVAALASEPEGRLLVVHGAATRSAAEAARAYSQRAV